MSNTLASVYDAEGNTRLWDPLNHSGDALRLAIRLGIEIYRDAVWCEVAQIDINGDNTYTATFRAIVKAAAEIGKKMK